MSTTALKCWRRTLLATAAIATMAAAADLRLQASSGAQTVRQHWDGAASGTAAAGPAAAHGAAPPMHPSGGAAGLPYVIRYGNLHSQTNHSDGGGTLGHCSGAQDPQSAALGPADAYDYARRHGLDFLMTSEHNHMYDVSDGTNASADPAAAHRQMRARGWIGQFNHPAEDQFAVDGQALAYTADGDQVMVLCEVMNSNAFSQAVDESETRHSNFEAACNKLLSAGYHLAFSSDQDNHCANWGASYSNRTGILLPPDAPFTQAALLDAQRARRVFATMDKNAYVVLRANGHLMGARFHNHGPLPLQVDYASSSGHHLDAIAILHAIPGAGGEFGAIAHATTSELQSAAGEHVYYARLVQDDGKLPWSAQVWITQAP